MTRALGRLALAVEIALRHGAADRRAVLKQPRGFRLRLLAAPALTPVAPGFEEDRFVGFPLLGPPRS